MNEPKRIKIVDIETKYKDLQIKIEEIIDNHHDMPIGRLLGMLEVIKWNLLKEYDKNH